VRTARISIRARFRPTQMCGPAPKARRSPRLAADVEAVGIGVVAFVAVAGPIDHDRPGTRRQQGSVNGPARRTGRRDRRVGPHDLADDTGSQGRVFTDQIPLFWMLGEQPDGAADREDRRVEARTHVVDRHDWTRLRGQLAPVNGVVDRLVPAAGFHFSRYRFVLCVARHLVEDRKRLDRHRGSSRLTVLPAGVGAEMSA
jgi:hypothetical protein